MLIVAYLVRVCMNSLDSRARSGVLDAYQLSFLISLDRQELFIVPRWKKQSTLGDGDLLPLTSSFKKKSRRRWRKSGWILYVVGLLMTLGKGSNLLWRHNGERLRLREVCWAFLTSLPKVDLVFYF